jgi:hypothetical protein
MSQFHGVMSGKRGQPLRQIDMPVWFGTPDNFRKETLTFEVVGSGACITPSSGGPVMPSSWRS